MANTEIEIQVQVENVSPLLKFLKLECKKPIKNRQIDYYFTPHHINFIKKKPVDEWLRLRNEDGNYFVTYKNWHHHKDGKSYYCDEYETKISNIEQMKMIFKSIGIKQIAEVDKLRIKYNYNNYEISIDRVKKLGDFIEIEYKGDSNIDNAKIITQNMISFLKEKNVGKIYRNYVGYPFQILFPDDIELEEY